MSDEQTNLQEAFLATLQSLGGGAQHPVMIAALGWTSEQYTAIKDGLLTAGQIKKRRGRSGGVALLTYTPSAAKAPKKTKLPPPEVA